MLDTWAWANSWRCHGEVRRFGQASWPASFQEFKLYFKFFDTEDYNVLNDASIGWWVKEIL